MNEPIPGTDLKAIADRRTAYKHSLAAGLLFAGVLLAIAFLPVSSKPTPIAIESPETVDSFKDISLTGEAAIVYDLAHRKVLYEKNAEAQVPLASLAKLLTVQTTFEALGGDAEVTIDIHAIRAEGDSGFKAGERFTVRDLAALALVGSSNDAAAALVSEASARRGESETALLASAAAALGLAQTYAVNGTGLDSSEHISGAYGSAHDVALMAGAIARNLPDVARLTTDGAVAVTSLSGKKHSLPNTDPYAVTIPGLLLSKTGYTDLAGGNLALVFDAGVGHPIAVVVLASTREGRFIDALGLIQATQSLFTLSDYAH